ncbi:Uncharacterised protein [Raoultella terrigena]|uniref:Uncharacterized protein n=1 Tax=Raoultella terrigena TaxID=577 RepID=A0A4U9D3C8_RAOTE|nr:Uncharacterised protein [Raoultella terrigena]
MFGKPRLQPAEGSAGADANDDSVDIAVELGEDFWRGGADMRQRIGLVIKLIDIERPRRLLRQATGVILIVGRVAFIHVGAGEQHRCPQRPQMEYLLAAHFVGDDEDQAVVLLRRNERQAEPGIAGGGFNNRAAGLQLTEALGLVNHRQRDAILNRTAGVLVFQLEEQATGAGFQLVQLEQGRVADKIANRMKE